MWLKACDFKSRSSGSDVTLFAGVFRIGLRRLIGWSAFREPVGISKRFADDVFELTIHTAKLVVRPAAQGVESLRVGSKQE